MTSKKTCYCRFEAYFDCTENMWAVHKIGFFLDELGNQSTLFSVQFRDKLNYDVAVDTADAMNRTMV